MQMHRGQWMSVLERPSLVCSSLSSVKLFYFQTEYCNMENYLLFPRFPRIISLKKKKKINILGGVFKNIIYFIHGNLCGLSQKVCLSLMTK